MTPCQKLLKQEGTVRRIESMQQSSATPSLHLWFWGLRKIVACSQSSSQCLLVSTVFGTVSFLHPTSFLMIFTLVYNKQMWMIVMIAFAMRMQPALILREDTIVCMMLGSPGMACFVSVRYTSHQMVCRFKETCKLHAYSLTLQYSN